MFTKKWMIIYNENSKITYMDLRRIEKNGKTIIFDMVDKGRQRHFG